ncbi:hypothetical protein GCM10007049_17940 [Echinicola pacifica]|uniref:DinB-like domain-containing protein n=1 Tax=Echinicola pacifica TaxID=346377 RepID=A0A918PZ21_9BACT|nr:DinB family protein [Echinicola pacifica]GGZ25789.1 hypothetical protein GCM10007049_17940 [Echinicola pacifica]
MNERLVPSEGEYGEFYETYISKVRGRDLDALMLSQVEDLRQYFEGMKEEQAAQSYEEGKWSLKELIGHINDTEKVMLYRALCIARGEKQSLPSMDQEEYVAKGNFNDQPLALLLEDFELTRFVIRNFFRSLSPDALTYTGSANGYTTSVRALMNIIPGHFLHHMQILKERY